jgi:K+ transporter
MSDSAAALSGGPAAHGSQAPVPEHGQPHVGFWTLTVGSIGVVYGDIDTSPLYALRESVLAAAGLRPSPSCSAFFR